MKTPILLVTTNCKSLIFLFFVYYLNEQGFEYTVAESEFAIKHWHSSTSEEESESLFLVFFQIDDDESNCRLEDFVDTFCDEHQLSNACIDDIEEMFPPDIDNIDDLLDAIPKSQYVSNIINSWKDCIETAMLWDSM